MNNIDQEILESSIKSLESTRNKLQNSYQTMREKGANTTLVEKRLNAVKIGLESLKGEQLPYDLKTIQTATEVLQSLVPPIEKQLEKAKAGSPQKTLNERRLTALTLAIQILNNY